jgi:hypothetical protein
MKQQVAAAVFAVIVASSQLYADATPTPRPTPLTAEPTSAPPSPVPTPQCTFSLTTAKSKVSYDATGENG